MPATIKPLLARHCVSCHGAAKPRGGLRLDTAAAARKGGKEGPAVVPGKAEESPLLAAVLGEGSTERMPLNRPPLLPDGDRPPAGLDRPGSAGARPTRSPSTAVHWAFMPAATAGGSRGRASRLGPQPDRPVHPPAARAGGAGAVARGRSQHAAAPRFARPHRPAAQPRGAGGVPGRHPARRLRARRRSAAGLAPFRRAVGPALARPGPVRRFQRLQHRRPPVDLEVSRLGHRRVQRRHAVRPVRDRPDRRRPAAAMPASTRRSPPGSIAIRRSTRKGESTSSSSGSSRSSTG